MLGRLPLPVLLAAAIALAACMGGGDAALEVEAGACADPPCVGASALSGQVVDDEQRPVAGANVTLEPGAVATRSDDRGRFAFAAVAPGAYELVVARAGFAPSATPVNLTGGAPLEVTVRLVPILAEDAFHEVIGPLSGMFSCGIGTPARIAMCHTYGEAAFAADKPRLDFRMSAAHWQTFVGEMRWTQGTAATSTHLANYMSFDGAKNGVHWWCAADGPSPTLFRFERILPSVCSDQGVTNPLPSPDMTLVVAADVGFAGSDAADPPLRVAVEQRFHLMMTIFYGEPGPPEWTAFADA